MENANRSLGGPKGRVGFRAVFQFPIFFRLVLFQIVIIWITRCSLGAAVFVAIAIAIAIVIAIAIAIAIGGVALGVGLGVAAGFLGVGGGHHQGVELGLIQFRAFAVC